MDEEKRQQRVEEPEEIEAFDEEPRDEIREPRQDRRADVDDFDEDGDRFEEERAEEVRARRPVATEKELIPLLDEGDAEAFRSSWQDIQTDFVDDPRNSVKNADELVAQVINSITENFANERNSLEEQWTRGGEASTEDLRLAMKRYRSFFNRLLTLEAQNPEELE